MGAGADIPSSMGGGGMAGGGGGFDVLGSLFGGNTDMMNSVFSQMPKTANGTPDIAGVAKNLMMGQGSQVPPGSPLSNQVGGGLTSLGKAAFPGQQQGGGQGGGGQQQPQQQAPAGAAGPPPQVAQGLPAMSQVKPQPMPVPNMPQIAGSMTAPQPNAANMFGPQMSQAVMQPGVVGSMQGATQMQPGLMGQYPWLRGQ